MSPDLLSLYRLMLFSRLYEKSVTRLWRAGKISGEMHLGLGEEAIAAGIISQLIDGDALALDHRGTPELLMRGIDPVRLLRELLGRSDGLCSGMGGHMHLFAPDKMAAASGIVGCSGPAAAGFALAAKRLRPGTVAVAFFGEGAMNQGMLMESLNLACAWNLPVLFVCKESQYSITTHTSKMTGGSLLDRARSFGLATYEVDGLNVLDVWNAANAAIKNAREGKGPSFLLAHCVHLEGHFLGDPLLEMGRTPLRAVRKRGPGILMALNERDGIPLGNRLKALMQIYSTSRSITKQASKANDPIRRTRNIMELNENEIEALENKVRDEVDAVVAEALREQEVLA